MGAALIRGMLDAKLVGPQQIAVGEKRETLRAELVSRYGIAASEDNLEAVRGARVVVLAVKPQVVPKVLAQLKGAIAADALVVSVAAGISIATIEAGLEPGARVIRTMPNVAAIVGQGATGIAASEHVSSAELAIAQEIFDSVGMSVVLDESQLDAVTGLSGSGPAFIFMVIEALADAGVKVGLSRLDAHALSCQTVLGAAKLVIETKEHPMRLKDMVCSPGGTAIAAVHTLEQGGLRTTLINAVEVATRRSAELGEANGKR